MKIKFLFLFLFISGYGFSQSVNDYVAVIIPVKYDFVKSENQYRLNTLTKFNLQKAGFEAYYTSETIPYNNRCSLLYADVQKEGGFMITKLFVVFKDCNGKVVFKSEIGKSKEKDFEVAYTEALNNAFVSVYALHYKYNGGAISNQNKPIPTTPNVPVVAAAAVATAVTSVTSATTNETFLLFAQPIKNGYQLVDSSPKVVMKVYNTTNPSVFLATKENIQGVLMAKDNQWFFEYYDKETLMSEKIAVKF